MKLRQSTYCPNVQKAANLWLFLLNIIISEYQQMCGSGPPGMIVDPVTGMSKFKVVSKMERCCENVLMTEGGRRFYS